jgi:hypothetical protein
MASEKLGTLVPEQLKTLKLEKSTLLKSVSG